MEIKKPVIERTVGTENILIPIGKTLSEYNGIFTLSPSAAVAFRAIKEGCDEDGAVKAVLAEFDVDEETAKKDVADFIGQLRSFGIV